MSELAGIFASWLEAAYHSIKPFIVIDAFEKGVRLRWGKNPKTLDSGFHWKLPFIDDVMTCSVAMETINTKSQSIMTKDKVSVFLEGAVKCRVNNPEIYLLEVTDVQNAISDVAQSEIKKVIIKYTFEECCNTPEEIDKEISTKLRAQAKKWGIHVESLVLTTFDKGKTIRLIQS